MQLADKVLVHQVHPAKITTDVTASVVSNKLLWRGRPKAALAVRIVLPVGGLLAVLTLADLDALAQTAPGRYVLAHMSPSAQAVRLDDDALMDLGARRCNFGAPVCRRGCHRGPAGRMRPSREHLRA